MSSPKNRFDPEVHILPCPFNSSCTLPQTENICLFPNYRQCSEFQQKERNLKSSYRIM
ncbi:MAG: hypothetical protein GF311_07170 [Candidatus Lokiarchaeota archaeon]|nr:hypothetical protein [Candidatus Lokiarchaeota archaeon]